MARQATIDTSNRRFWDELCGTGLATKLGITEHTPESLQRFDKAYMDLYPYLPHYLHIEDLSEKQVLEIGLGYGTLGQKIIECGAVYHGIDIAASPTHMMKYRSNLLSSSAEDRILQGSALELPYADTCFDFVYAIGVLHHTGNLSRAVNEIHRTLKPGGYAVIMVYNKDSFVYYKRLLKSAVKSFKSAIRNQGQRATTDELLRASYDATTADSLAAPHIDFVSRRTVRQLFRAFSAVTIDSQNFENLTIPVLRIRIPREIWLRNLARVTGSDFYITAIR